MNAESLGRIERLNYMLGAGLILVCAGLTTTHFTLGVALGVLLTCLNFSIIRLLVNKLLASAPDKRGGTALYFIPKMSGILVAVSLAVFFLPISPIGIGIGFSIFLLSILVETVRFIGGGTLSP